MTEGTDALGCLQLGGGSPRSRLCRKAAGRRTTVPWPLARKSRTKEGTNRFPLFGIQGRQAVPASLLLCGCGGRAEENWRVQC